MTREHPSYTNQTPSISNAQAHLLNTHVTTLARNKAKLCQVLVDKAPGTSTNGISILSKEELVVKGTVALDLMDMEASDAPEGTYFNGAKKFKNGGVVYEMNTTLTWSCY